MHYRLFFTVLIILHLQQSSFGQDPASTFFEIIKDDSVLMYFNDQNKFIEKRCSDFARHTRVDQEGYFNGYFEDRSHKNVLISKGNYIHGIKHGYFETYYRGGEIRSKGNYKDNRPVGRWEYFYENKLPERIIEINESDTLLIRFVDKAGNVKVIGGNGEFSGFVTGNSDASNLITATGRVENGKPNGKWTSSFVMNNKVYCKEEFVQGKLVRGSFPNALLGGNREYTNKSILNTFFLTDHLNSLEEFGLAKCADSVVRTSSKYTFDMQMFSLDLRDKIDNVVENDFRNRRANEYSIGENYITIQFFVNEEGKAKDFLLLTGWGQQFVTAISTSIRMQAKFPPQTKTMYFHLKLNFPGGFTYQYGFYFSKERLPN